MSYEHNDAQGRYVHDITEGMWVMAWDGQFRQVATIESDAFWSTSGPLTLRFTDGTATTLPATQAVLTRDA